VPNRIQFLSFTLSFLFTLCYFCFGLLFNLVLLLLLLFSDDHTINSIFDFFNFIFFYFSSLKMWRSSKCSRKLWILKTVNNRFFSY
jgi:hypothetical protein